MCVCVMKYSCVLTFKLLLFNFMILTNTKEMLHPKGHLRFIKSSHTCASLSVCPPVCLSTFVTCDAHSMNLCEILYWRLLCKSNPKNYKLG